MEMEPRSSKENASVTQKERKKNNARFRFGLRVEVVCLRGAEIQLPYGLRRCFVAVHADKQTMEARLHSGSICCKRCFKRTFRELSLSSNRTPKRQTHKPSSVHMLVKSSVRASNLCCHDLSRGDTYSQMLQNVWHCFSTQNMHSPG